MVLAKQKSLEAVYVAAICLNGISAFGLSFTKYKAAVIPFIGLVFLDFCYFGNFGEKRTRRAEAFLGEYAKYILLIVLVTLLVYVADTADMALMKRGFQKVFFQTLTVLGAVAAGYAFGKRAILLTYYGMAAANLAGIVRAVALAPSLSQCVSDFTYFLTSGFDAVGFMKNLELHELTFPFGLLIIAFMIDGTKKNLGRILVCLFFFFLGFKRIGMFGVALAAAFYFLMRKERMRLLKVTGLMITTFLLLYGIGYVAFVRSGLLVKLTAELQINIMGRQNLYKYIADYYRISPFFLGHGFGCIEYILGRAGDIKVENTYISRMTALHCDYLAMYIQMGMGGFLLWESYKFIDVPLFCERYGRKCFLAALLTTMYLGMTYMTDNTALYFLVCMVHFLVPMALADTAGEEEKQ